MYRKEIAVLLVAMCCLAACSSGPTGVDGDAPLAADQLAKLIGDVSVTRVGDDGDAQPYRVSVTVAAEDGVRLPEALRILAHTEDTQPTVLYDDGQHDDLARGDGVYSGRASRACVPGDTASKADVSCTFKFVGPGEKCGSWGTCPKTASRSFLWGLIEYDTDIVVCFCLEECKIGK